MYSSNETTKGITISSEQSQATTGIQTPYLEQVQLTISLVNMSLGDKLALTIFFI